MKVCEKVDGSFLNNSIPCCDETWARNPYRREELNELCKIDPTMSEEEINKRIKATTYPGMPGAYIELYGKIFKY